MIKIEENASLGEQLYCEPGAKWSGGLIYFYDTIEFLNLSLIISDIELQ